MPELLFVSNHNIRSRQSLVAFVAHVVLRFIDMSCSCSTLFIVVVCSMYLLPGTWVHNNVCMASPDKHFLLAVLHRDANQVELMHEISRNLNISAKPFIRRLLHLCADSSCHQPWLFQVNVLSSI